MSKAADAPGGKQAQGSRRGSHVEEALTSASALMLRELNEISRESSVERIYHSVVGAMQRLLPVEHAAVLLVEDSGLGTASPSCERMRSMLPPLLNEGLP